LGRQPSISRRNRLTIGYTPGVMITSVVRDLRHRHPDAEVSTRYQMPWGISRFQP
jgi:hypothetical protein